MIADSATCPRCGGWQFRLLRLAPAAGHGRIAHRCAVCGWPGAGTTTGQGGDLPPQNVLRQPLDRGTP